MTIQLVKKLHNIKDLLDVEKTLRAMYQTADGAICQAMMTMEYKCWRHNVMRRISSSTPSIPSQQDSQNQLRLQPDAEQSIKAILIGFKIVFVNDTCFISQLLPGTYEATWQKDNAKLLTSENETTVDNSMRQECSYNVFKKHKICLSQRQV